MVSPAVRMEGFPRMAEGDDDGLKKPRPAMAMDHLPERFRMEAAVERIESDVRHFQEGDVVSETRGDVKDMRDRLARLEVNVQHLPSKGFIVSIVLAASALLAAATLFQSKLLVLLGLAPH
jgi:hypothetical protein